MRQTGKIFFKKLFGPHDERLKRMLPVWLILFFSFYLSGIRLPIAPSVLYLTVFSFSAGIMWRLLTSEGSTKDMRQLFLLPFDSPSLVFSYIFALGAYTLLTKTAGLLAVMLAVCPWSKTEILRAFLCAASAVLMTPCCYALRRENTASVPGQRPLAHIARVIGQSMSAFWPAAFLAAILLQPDSSVFLLIILGGSLHAVILLWNTDAYTFFGGETASRRHVRSGRHMLPPRYLTRYLLAHKSYLLNTLVLWGVAGVLPVFFAQAGGSFALLIGFSVLSLNTPICILLSCDPALEQALRFLPRQKQAFLVPYCLFIFCCNLSADLIFLVSFALQLGGVNASMCLTAVLFALLAAACAVLLEWFFPLRGWKTENDLLHHPRKYVVPAALLLLAGLLSYLSSTLM